MQAVFLDQQTFNANVDLSTLSQTVDKLTCYATTHAEQIKDRCIDADIILTNKVVLDKETLQKLPKLKLICITATGYNNVDIPAAKALNIAVTNVSGYAKNSVSQYVFAQLLHYYSKVAHHNQNTAQGFWPNSPTFCFHGEGSQELAGKIMGIIGYGALGKQVATIAKAFGMTVLIAERPTATSIRPNRLAFNHVIEQADVISLHCPQTPETELLFNREKFAAMKKSAILINTARGSLINNDDLLFALEEQQIACAILDVLEQEPPPENHILLRAQSEKLIITAHIAWASEQAQQSLLNLVAKNIYAFKQGEQLNRIDN